MQSPSIKIQNAYLRYHHQILFDDLNCNLPAGKTTCLLGPSGVGKTSLLRLIAGFKPIDQKTTQSALIETSDRQSLSHRIAYMAQTDLLMPWLSVLDNVLLGYRLRRETTDSQAAPNLQKLARELITKVGLSNAAEKYPQQLSGGMRQRAALARTLIEDKPVVLMDEPFSSLDAITRLKLQDLAGKLLQQRTVLLITHDPLEALRLGHQLLIMTGQPARLDIMELSGAPPRAINDEKLLHWQALLMEKLL